MNDLRNPFHEGEIEAQKRAGAMDVASWAAGFIRDYMPEQHRDFFTALPFMVVTGLDEQDRMWTSIIEGESGFIRSPSSKQLHFATAIEKSDPLYHVFNQGADIGAIGIELASRRRNRFSGSIIPDENGFRVDIKQSFGNCPQYITEREWYLTERVTSVEARETKSLNSENISLIQRCDTLFLGTGHAQGEETHAQGFDSSHRGGAAGFVSVKSPSILLIPDYAGNNFFNSIGNLIKDPRISVLFVEFNTGTLLHVSGTAEIDWDGKSLDDPNARRVIKVNIEHVTERPSALALRWADLKQAPKRFRIAKKVKESSTITSFILMPQDGTKVDRFEPGQHLPISVNIPGERGLTSRAYSLSGPPHMNWYRISIKREEKGLMSRFMHDTIQEGDIIQANRPSGDFVVPCSECPLVLVSAGVGITPMLSVLHSVHEQAEKRNIWFVHSTRNSKEHSFKREVEVLSEQNANIHKRLFYSKPLDIDKFGQHYDQQGRISPEYLKGLSASNQTHYMLCGPASFLSDMKTGLELLGASSDQIHFEIFGPSG